MRKYPKGIPFFKWKAQHEFGPKITTIQIGLFALLNKKTQWLPSIKNVPYPITQCLQSSLIVCADLIDAMIHCQDYQEIQGPRITR